MYSYTCLSYAKCSSFLIFKQSNIKIIYPLHLEPTEPHFKNDPDDNKSFQQICIENGYPFESHEVITEDNYLLTLYRIKSSPKLKESTQQRPVMFVQHGLGGSAQDYIVNSSDKSIAFLLADAGFDTWFGNSRGSTFSLKHMTLTPNDPQFWNFSWVEMGRYDLTAEIDYALKISNVEKLSYLGHSQGTTQMFVGLAENMEWFRERVHSFTALGPVHRLANNKSFIFSSLADFQGPVFELAAAIGLTNIMQRGSPSKIQEYECDYFPSLCALPWYLTCEQDPSKFLNYERIGVATAHGPNGEGLHDVEHYAQVIKNKNFQYFDHGKQQNQKLYNRDTPPPIPIENIQSFPIGLFVGQTDQLATVIDNDWMSEILKKQGALKEYKKYAFGHISFYLGKDMSYFLDDVIPFIKGSIEKEVSQVIQ